MISATEILNNWDKAPIYQSFDPDIQDFQALDVLNQLFLDIDQGRDHFFRVYTEGKRVMTDLNKLAPSTKENSSKPFLDRLCRENGWKDICFVLSDCNTLSKALAEFTRSFLDAVSPVKGVPYQIICTLFIGNQKYTPFGIHTDNDHTIFLLLEGAKRIYVWNKYHFNISNYWGLSASEKYIEACCSVKSIKANELCYIPKGFPHFFESESDFYVGLSIGLPAPGVGLISDLYNSDYIGLSQNGFYKTSQSRHFGEESLLFCDRLKIHTQSEAFHIALTRKLLELDTGRGIANPVNFGNPKLLDSTVITSTVEVDCLHEFIGNTTIVACSGNSFAAELLLPTEILQVLDYLNHQKSSTISSLTTKFKNFQKTELLTFIAHLYRIGAINVT